MTGLCQGGNEPAGRPRRWYHSQLHYQQMLADVHCTQGQAPETLTSAISKYGPSCRRKREKAYPPAATEHVSDPLTREGQHFLWKVKVAKRKPGTLRLNISELFIHSFIIFHRSYMSNEALRWGTKKLATGVDQSVKALACRSGVALGRGFNFFYAGFDALDYRCYKYLNKHDDYVEK
ncbi:hypothetical protein ANN_14508 [Periplaneta americana]|uniref:Uncharacterized protein n=1 Tax=Periplaneta americana TaxID=6978 RepID=A0ABQ8SXQ4_PERAM|nr:hypothetical protein ANN_14508 [Periplaneta americana]